MTGSNPTETRPCFGCAAEIASTPGNYYCGSCIAEQSRAAEAERRAFELYHRFADSVARGDDRKRVV